MIFGLGINFSPPTGIAYWILHSLLALAVLTVFCLSGIELLKRSVQQILTLQPGVESLFLLGVAGAFAASLHSTLTRTGDIYYEVVAILVSIYSLGTALGNIQRQKAMQAIDSLESRYAEARLPDGTTVASHDIHTGQRIIVRPGEGIPADGKILEGTALVHETPLTGEPFAVHRKIGDYVMAGSDNLDGYLTIQAVRPGSDRQLDQLLKTLKSSRLKKSRIQQNAHHVARIFFPVVVAISLLTFIFWWWRGDWQSALFHALAVIVVACPCALGLATPLAIWSSINRLYQIGIITRQSDFIERLDKVDTIVFDKTGTLSNSRPKLSGFYCLPGISENKLKASVSAVQSEFDHPLSSLFKDWTAGPRPVSCQTIAGAGVSARMPDASEIRIGNRHILEPAHLKNIDLILPEGSTCCESQQIYILLDGSLVAIAEYQETLRPETRETISTLKNAGYDVIIMSGDQKERVAMLSPEGVAFEAGLKPLEKRDRIQHMQSQGKHVLFVGDGTNDAPALEAAYASLAMQEGSKVSAQTSQASIRTDRIAPILSALQLSRKTIRTLKENLIFATAYNVIGISLAATGILNPVWAALLMLASSVSVSARALRNAATSLDRSQLERSNSAQQPPNPRIRWQHALFFVGNITATLLFSYAGHFSWQNTVIFTTVIGAGSLLTLRTLSHLSSTRRLCAVCFSWCTVGMFIGWIIIAGWQRVVHDGVCLCGCEDSPFGQGIASFINPMYGLMIAFSAGAAVLSATSASCWRSLKLHFLCALFMAVAMWLTSLWWARVPVHPDAQIQFLMTTGIMLLSMLGAVVCFEWIKLRISIILPQLQLSS